MKHLISLIKSSKFGFEHTINIQENYLVNPIFDETIKLRDDLYIMAYSTNEKYYKDSI